MIVIAIVTTKICDNLKYIIQQIQAEKGLAKDAIELDKQKGILIKLTEEVSYLTRRVEKLSKTIQQSETDQKAHRVAEFCYC